MDRDWNVHIPKVYTVRINFGENLRILALQWGVKLLTCIIYLNIGQRNTN